MFLRVLIRLYSVVHGVEDYQAFPLLSPLKMDVSSQVEDHLRVLRKMSFLAILGESRINSSGTSFI